MLNNLQDRDFNDGKAWSSADVEDLRMAIEGECTIEHAARFLSRATTVAEVEAKARELGLEVRHECAAPH